MSYRVCRPEPSIFSVYYGGDRILPHGLAIAFLPADASTSPGGLQAGLGCGPLSCRMLWGNVAILRPDI